MTVFRSVAPLLPLLITAAVTFAACGADGSTDLVLSPAGDAGRQVTLEKGCASCHGTNGQGGVGPTFVGLFGSTVDLDGGGTVVADEAYITESILEPNAKRVDGYRLPMPQTNLTDAELASVIDYIRELAAPADNGNEPTGTSAP